MSSNVYTLTLLGTDTEFTPTPNEEYYLKGETLSYLATLLAGDSVLKPSSSPIPLQALKHQTEHSALIDGPTTLGSEVGDRIALAVLLSLQALAKSQTTHNIMGHSRGAVEAILVTNELYRIQQAIKTSNKSLPDILKDSPCALTQKGFASLQAMPVNEDDLKQHIQRLSINLSLLDPVPGGRFMGLYGTAWRDERFYQLPPIVKHCEEHIYKNEMTRCFKAIVPKAMEPAKTHIEYHKIPGHHGTGSGNFKTQQNQDVVNENSVDPKITCLIQELLLLKGVHFLTSHGSRLKELSQLKDHPLKKFVTDYDSTSYERKLTSLYNNIHRGKATFDLFNLTSYAVLGQEYYGYASDRTVHFHQRQNHYLGEVLVSSDDLVVNREHLRLKLTHWFPSDSKQSPSELLRCLATKLEEAFKEMAPSKQPERNSLAACLKKGSPQDLKLIDEAIKSLLNAASQSLILNHLSNTHKAALVEEVVALYETLPDSQDETIKARVERFKSIMNQQLQATIAHQLGFIRETKAFKDEPESYFRREVKQEGIEIIAQLGEKAKQLGVSEETSFQGSFKTLMNAWTIANEEVRTAGELFGELSQALSKFAEDMPNFREVIGTLSRDEQSQTTWLAEKRAALDERHVLAYEATRDLLQALGFFKTNKTVARSLGGDEYFEPILGELKANQTIIEPKKQLVAMTSAPKAERSSVKSNSLGVQTDNDQSEQLERELSVQKEQCDALKQQISNQDSRISDLNETITEKESLLETLRGLVNKKPNPQIKYVYTDTSHLANKIKKLKTSEAVLESSKAALESQLQVLKSQNEIVAQEKDGEIVKLQQQLSKQSENCEALQKEIQAQASTISDLMQREPKTIIVEIPRQFTDFDDVDNSRIDSADCVETNSPSTNSAHQRLIDQYLMPLTSKYCDKLHRETYSHKNIEDAPSSLNEKYQILMGLMDDLRDGTKEPQTRVKNFYTQINAKQKILETHRDPRSRRWLKNTLLGVAAIFGTIATGFIPGALVMAYAASHPNSSLRFWSSHGTRFTKSAKEMEPATPCRQD